MDSPAQSATRSVRQQTPDLEEKKGLKPRTQSVRQRTPDLEQQNGLKPRTQSVRQQTPDSEQQHGPRPRTRLLWWDLLSIAIIASSMGAMTLWVPNVFLWNRRQIIMTFDSCSKTWIGPVELSYPYKPFTVPVWLAGLLATGVPVLFFVAMQIFVKSRSDCVAASLGVMEGVLLL